MKYIVRFVAVLVVLGAAGLAGYAYLGKLDPVQSQVAQPVKLNVD